MGKRKPKKKTTTLYIAIEVEHPPDADVSDMLDHVLDNGDLQDALTGYADAAGHTIEVTGCYEVSCVCQRSDTDTESHRGHKGICGTVTCRAMEDTKP